MTVPEGLAGRQSELFRLGAAWGNASRGRPSLFVLVGQPGVGKTALLEAVARLAGRTGGRIVRLGDDRPDAPGQPADTTGQPTDATGRTAPATGEPTGTTGRSAAAAADDQPVLVIADDLDEARAAVVRDRAEQAQRRADRVLAVTAVSGDAADAVLAVLGDRATRIDLRPPAARPPGV